MRRTMSQNRPLHWPPPMIPLSDDEIRAQAHKEVACRESLQQATMIVRNREIFRLALEHSEQSGIDTDAFRMNDSLQNEFCAPNDDRLRCDSMERFIEMTSPLLERLRMIQIHYKYMLSSLVLNLNMHWWAHTGSYFKSGRATSNAAVCRYLFLAIAFLQRKCLNRQ